MKYLAAYLLASIGGNKSPSEKDILKILGASFWIRKQTSQNSIRKLTYRNNRVILRVKERVFFSSREEIRFLCESSFEKSVWKTNKSGVFWKVILSEIIFDFLEAGGLDCDMENAKKVSTALSGKSIPELVSNKFSNFNWR